MVDSYKTPQVHLIGKIAGASHFLESTIYLKYQFKFGEKWTLLAGEPQGDTFQSAADKGKFIPLEQPFDMNFTAQSVRGWPKLFLEVWQVDGYGRNSIAGYGIGTLPIQSGEYKIWIPCWRPKADFYDQIIGAYPELIHKDILISSENRYGLKTESTGKILVEISVMTKDFHLHGVKLQEEVKHEGDIGFEPIQD